jgi:hypothetical protein
MFDSNISTSPSALPLRATKTAALAASEPLAKKSSPARTPSKLTKSSNMHSHEIVNLIAAEEEEKSREKCKSSPKGKRKVGNNYYSSSSDSSSSEESVESGSSDNSKNSDEA